MRGPVQVLVVGLDEPSFSGEVIAEFTRLRDAGIVRLVDLLVVRRGADGALDVLPAPGDPTLGNLATALFGSDEVSNGAEPAMDEQAWSLDDAVPDGGCAAVALIEHLWAGPLAAAIRGAGGQPLDETWLSPADADRLSALEQAAAG